MEAMTLEQSAYLAEIVGVFAIVASLVYLGFQVRQNTRTTRLETVQAISTEWNSWMDMIASSRDLAETYHRGTFDFQRLDATQKIQFTFAISRCFRTMHELYFQWREGAMDTAIWQLWVATYTDGMQYPGWQEVWKARKHVFTKEFQSFMDNLIEAKGTKPLYDAPQT